MSRVAKAPITVPTGVDVKIDNGTVTVKGSKGELSLALVKGMQVVQEDEQLKVSCGESKDLIPMSGTTRALIQNMITGVAEGFEKKLTIIGVGYRAQAAGKLINLQLGFSHEVKHNLPEGVTAETPSNTEIIIRGADKQSVGQVAADIRSYRPPEPYKGKGIRYSDEYVVRKQAKKA